MEGISELQKVMYLNWKQNPLSGIDIEQWVFHLVGIDFSRFEQAWDTVLKKNASINRCFIQNWGEIGYTTRNGEEWPFYILDRKINLEEFLGKDRISPIDLEAGPLMHFTLVPEDNNAGTCIWTFHHIQLDAGSALELLRQVALAYANINITDSQFSPKNAEVQEYTKDFWPELLTNADYGTLPQNGSKNTELKTRVLTRQDIIIPKETWSGIRMCIHQAGFSDNSYIQVLWTLFLYWVTGKRINVFAAVRSGRFKNGIDQRNDLGCFIETVPFPVYADKETTLSAMMSKAIDLQAALRPYEKDGILKIAGQIKDYNLQEKMFSLVNFDNHEFEDVLHSFGGVFKGSSLVVFEDSGFPLTLSCRGSEHLSMSLVSEARVFTRDQLKIFLGLIISLCAEMAGNLNSTPDDIIQKIVTMHEQSLMYPSPDRQFFSFRHPIENFITVSQHNSKPAISFGNVDISYADLLVQVQQYACAISAFSAKKYGLKIGIYLPRNIALISVILSIGYIGAAFIPLDPDFPLERLKLIVEDSELDFIITDRLHEINAAQLSKTLLLRETIESAGEGYIEPVLRNPDDPVYIMFTSGSTGNPKGVVITWAGLSNLLQALRSSMKMESGDILLSHTTISFDISIMEIFMPLTLGASIVLASGEVAKNPQKIMQLLDEKEVTFLMATPAMYQLLLASGWTGNKRLKLLCGGDVLSPPLAGELQARVGTLWNGYGPTEITVCSSMERIADPSVISIGFPLPGLVYTIVGPHGFPMPGGIPGELCISGVQLASSYYNKKELTEKAFPVMKIGNTSVRTYRTGDLVRFSDNRFEFLGRLDNQVKLRGFRIELGEIESVLKSAAGLVDPVVLLQDGNKPFLVAYYKGPEGSASFQKIKELVKDRLPRYMIPEFYMRLESYPVTPTGKIDRKHFPKMAVTEQVSDDALLNDEQKIASIWAKILELQEAPPDLHFFNSGGNSVTAISMVNEVSRRLNIPISVVTVYQDPLLRSFTQYVLKKETPGEQGPVKDDRLDERRKRMEKNRHLRRS